MRQTTGTRKSPGEKLVKDIKRRTRAANTDEVKYLFHFNPKAKPRGVCYNPAVASNLAILS